MERTLDAQDNEKPVIDKVKDKEIELIEKRNEVEELKKTKEEILKLRVGAEEMQSCSNYKKKNQKQRSNCYNSIRIQRCIGDYCSPMLVCGFNCPQFHFNN